jgi:site-specific recombinase XerD
MVADLLYGSPKCTVARLDFDRKQVVQGKGKKDRYVPLGTLDSGLKKYIEAENLKIIF